LLDEDQLAIKLEEEIRTEKDLAGRKDSQAVQQEQGFKAFLDKSGWQV
jgi:hypothetical protein